MAACGVRFGWNRSGLGGPVDLAGRLAARRVFLPGSVFVLEKEPENLSDLLVRGLGIEKSSDIDGRLQGYGAVLPHPGVATEAISNVPELVSFGSDESAHWALNWRKRSKTDGLSASQVAAVASRINALDGQEAIKFLERQRFNRSRGWGRWKNVHEDLVKTIGLDPQRAKKALRIWHDLISAGEEARS